MQSQTIITREQFKKALYDKEFYPVYQPKVDREKNIIGYEALCRWGNKNPNDFLQLALIYRLFLPLSILMAEKITKDIKKYNLISVSINLSPVQLHNLTHLLELTNILKSVIKKIDFEITEDSVIDDKAVQSLRFLAKQDFKIGLDDFGVGYTRISVLPQLPLNYVKFDRSLCMKAYDQDYAVLMRHWIDYFTYKYKNPLTGDFSIPSVAEGVETEKELKSLKTIGFTAFQGYLFGKPALPIYGIRDP